MSMLSRFQPFIFSICTLSFFNSCAPSDIDIQEDVVEVIGNVNIMVDVTAGHVTLSGFVYSTDDTMNYSEKILEVKGVTGVENNISYFSQEELMD